MEGKVQVCLLTTSKSTVVKCSLFYSSDLNSQWEQKVKIIDSLELNLQQVQKSFKEKEGQLLLEKDQALREAK